MFAAAFSNLADTYEFAFKLGACLAGAVIACVVWQTPRWMLAMFRALGRAWNRLAMFTAKPRPARPEPPVRHRNPAAITPQQCDSRECLQRSHL